MKLYVFNTLVIPVNFDEQEEVQIKTRRVSLEEAREIVREAKEQGALESAVGHQGSAELLTSLLGVEIPFQRRAVYMQKGDRGLHLFLKQRLPEGVVLSREELEKLSFWLVLSEIE